MLNSSHELNSKTSPLSFLQVTNESPDLPGPPSHEEHFCYGMFISIHCKLLGFWFIHVHFLITVFFSILSWSLWMIWVVKLVSLTLRLQSNKISFYLGHGVLNTTSLTLLLSTRTRSRYFSSPCFTVMKLGYGEIKWLPEKSHSRELNRGAHAAIVFMTIVFL